MRLLASSLGKSFGSARFLNIGWNVAGMALPAIAALISVPFLISGLGLEKFGILSLCWIVTGYFSIFDFGIGRILTIKISALRPENDLDTISAVTWNALWFLVILSMLMSLILFFSAHHIAQQIIKSDGSILNETNLTLEILSISVPFVILTAALRGIMEAYNNFYWSNSIRIFTGILIYVLPAIALLYSDFLPTIVILTIAVRIIGFIAHAIICFKEYVYLRTPRAPDGSGIRSLLSFGGWLTVSNVVGPLLLYIGRFALAAIASASAVALFSTPYDLLANMLMLPAAIISVMIPTMSSLVAIDIKAAELEYKRGHLLIAIVIIPTVIVTLVALEPFLGWWINPGFAASAVPIAQILTIGFGINAFGHWSQSAIQVAGRPDLTAKLHIAELLAYLPYMYILTNEYGALGAALAWAVRVSISTIALGVIARSILNRLHRLG
jgi:O-antigen/teichoic acid export membrane protein